MKNKSLITATLILLMAVGGYFVWQQKINGSNEKVKVGVIAPLSGDNAYYGELLKRNFELAKEDYPKIELIYEDSKFSPTHSVSAFKKLIDFDNIKFILGEVASGNSIAVVESAIKSNSDAILFSSISSADKLKELGGKYFFRNIPSNNIQGVTVANFIYLNLKIKEVALIPLNDDYGVNISKIFKEHYIKLGGKIVLEESHQKGQTDFKTLISKVKKSNAKVIFIPGDKNEPALMMKQAKEMGLNLPFIGGDGSSNDDVIRIAGKASEGFYTSNVLVKKSSEYYKTYKSKFLTKFSKEPSAYDAYAYEAAQITFQTVLNNDYVKNDFINYLTNTEFESMTGKLHFDSKGQVDRLWGIYQVQNGKFVEIDK